MSLKGVITHEFLKMDQELLLVEHVYNDLIFSFLSPGLNEGGRDRVKEREDVQENDPDLKPVQQMTDIGSRRKRAILSFLTPLISTLLGTPDSEEWEATKINIDNLFRITDALKETLGDTLEIISITQDQVSANRKALNEIIISLHETREEMFQLIRQIQEEMQKQMQFTLMIDKIHGLFHVAETSLRMVLHRMATLRADLYNARMGIISPNLVPEGQLFKILRKIRASLPQDTELPAPLRHLSWYYSRLHCSMIPIDHGKIMFVLDVPLKSISDQYEAYRLTQSPGMMDGQRQNFDLESNIIAVSVDKQNYILLNQAELTMCTSGICQYRKPRYSYPDGNHCVLALFKESKEDIAKYCTLIRTSPTSGPSVKWLYDNSWVFEGLKGEKGTLFCGSYLSQKAKPQTVSFHDDIVKISIPSDCWIETKTIKTPKVLVTRETEAKINLVLGDSMANISDNFKIKTDFPWNDTILETQAQLPAVLEDVDITKERIAELHDKLKAIKTSKKETTYRTWLYVIVAGVCVVVSLLVTLVTVLYARYRYAALGHLRSSSESPETEMIRLHNERTRHFTRGPPAPPSTPIPGTSTSTNPVPSPRTGNRRNLGAFIPTTYCEIRDSELSPLDDNHADVI
jgi:hypothetical protein